MMRRQYTYYLIVIKQQIRFEGMLHLAVKKSRNRKNKKRFKAVISYLYTSRYKDYETALYKYAGDGTEQTERLFTDIIEKEAAKKRLLPLKEES